MRIIHIKITVKTWPDKFKNLFFKKPIRFRVLNIIKLIPLNNSEWKKDFWKYSYLTLNKGTLLCFVASCVGKTFEIMSEK